MDAPFDFQITDGAPLSRLCLGMGLTHFTKVCEHIQQLSYGRNTNKHDLSLVLSEGKGTCSTKHAFLAQIAEENTDVDIGLYIGIYRMNSDNTQGIGTILQEYELDFIPEAHTYLKYENAILDYTRPNPASFHTSIIYEERIIPEQITDYKVTLHKSFLKKWIDKTSIPYSLKELWEIRERCIVNLSQ